MPTYNFKNTKTGEEWEEFFTLSGKDLFLEQNPDIKQTPSMFSISASGTGDRIKTDAGWKENLSRIAKKHTQLLHWVINIIRRLSKNTRQDKS